MPGRIKFIPTWNKFSNSKLVFNHVLPKELTIITFGNNKHYNNKFNLFENSLENNKLSYLKLGNEIEHWINTKKIDLISENINNIKTKYVLFADNSDVLLVNKIDRILDIFLQFDCKALFNSEINFYPKLLGDEILNFEKKIFKNSFLNAGLWITELSFVKIIIKDLMELKLNSSITSEQYFYKKVYLKYFPLIKVDHKCEIFQGLNRIPSSEICFKYDF